MRPIHHALVLNLHQPSGNLEDLLENPDTAWEATEILYALDRIPRSLWEYQDTSRIHLSLSGTLLETLANPTFQRRVYGIVDCGSLLWHLQNRQLFEVLGTGFYHPVFPLIPPADWSEQIDRWLGIGRHLLWRDRIPGFWPPEMGFTPAMIPALKAAGYRYVLVDCKHVEPVDQMSWQELRYRPHVARYEGDDMIVIVRDRELSDAQESGMDYGWFYHELHERTKWCDFVPLVTTCTDGDNGGWFRNTNNKGNFWGAFYRPFMEEIRQGKSSASPIFIDDYLDRYGATGEVRVKEGAWNTGWHNGIDFVQWTGSRTQRDGLERVAEVSTRFHVAQRQLSAQAGEACSTAQWELDQAHWHLLRAQTSCNFYWGEAWVSRALSDLERASYHLDQLAGMTHTQTARY